MKIKKVSNVEELNQLIDAVEKSQRKYSRYSQAQVDEIFRRAAIAANDRRIELAKIAVADTGMGIMEDKVIKNHFSSEYIYNKYRDEVTCGVVEEDHAYGIKKIAEPIGILAGIVPVTNPTSTTIFKSLISLKTRNAIIFSPHPNAKNCTIEAAKTVLEAAIEAGAPENIIGWIDKPSIELSQHLMQHPKINLILATGGPGMVKAAYSSGKPALGVGAGNTPAIIDETAHLKMAVSSILMSKTFDNGVICASEQSVTVLADVYEQVKKEFIDRGAYILSEKEHKKLADILLIDGHINAKVVGQSAAKIAAMAGIKVAPETKILIAEVNKVGAAEPFSYEKLSPTLALYKANNFKAAVKNAVELVRFGGIGHTSVLYTDPINEDKKDYFSREMKTGRILVNMPASQGAIGDIYNFKLEPSLTLGCGSWGGNSVSENVGVKHLMNIKTTAERKENMLWFRVPEKIYFKYGALPTALAELKDKKRAFIMTDKPLAKLGYTDRVTDVLDKHGVNYRVFSDVEPDPEISMVRKAVKQMNSFDPDLIIALGGGSPMDAAKIAWLLYEHPEAEFKELSMTFMDIRKRIYKFPELGNKAQLVAIPTTSGTGSEVTPFAVVTDDSTGVKYPIADYELTPNMAIVDPDLVLSMPKTLTAHSGIDALVHAIEAYVSVLSSEYTRGLALEAIRLIFKYLPESYHGGSEARKAKEKIHYAATTAGMAFANAFLGICHSMAHKLGSAFHISHGLANALLINQVIKYNSSDRPVKQAAFPQYKYPLTKTNYAKIADHLNLGGNSDEEKVDLLIQAIEDLKKELDIPASIKEAGVSEKEFNQKIASVSELAFDDQCTAANPRYPLISEIKELYLKAYQGDL
ncbi:bifunctional acetaldehyde-CoA/alcohol dehydrogenase [Halanaerobium salsuginis]|jgi:acetaldehyde dehydrogenase/alcohol dehydrogenase|uniref:Aldehyde-alcohol dehydrogenase n=1 Tax=Halanaerobium salsuginis TaxID=29563 RepID=A0A1I4HQS3_9FIRM|nr:bifunctional acetaldehyde-CoA/alcohol dehydrogenase [Halanaerobium salsuginis]SFL44599.1 acetaldehyde dehydrogenase / alcohol dehydrogenase [Halanaerobium salsuginis]